MNAKLINKTALFIIIMFLLSYSLAWIYWFFNDNNSNRIGFMFMGAAYMFMPSISVLIVKKWLCGEHIITDLKVSFKLNGWFLAAWLLMPIVSFAALGVSLLFTDVSYNTDMTGLLQRFDAILTPQQMEQAKHSLDTMPINPLIIMLIQGLFAGITINAIAGLGEELGWRGFLLHQFRDMKFFKGSLLIGSIWGIWHAPLILMGHNYPQHPQLGVLMMIIWCMLLSVLFTYITIQAKSVIAAAIAHGTLNATAGISIMLLNGGNDLTVGITGLAGFITLFIFIALLFIYDQYISRDKIMIQTIKNNIYDSVS